MSYEKPYERILRERGPAPSAIGEIPGDEAEDYVPFHVSDGHPQMGFSLCTARQAVHGFMYHNLDNIQLIRANAAGWEHLQFTHRGKAVTLKGYGLAALFNGIMAHTLQTVFELGRTENLPEDETIIAHMIITTLPAADPDRMQEAAAMAS